MRERALPDVQLRLRDPSAVKADLEALPLEQLAQLSPRWLERVRNASAPDPWIHGFTACGADGSPVGQGAFKGPPADGAVEIAYQVDASCQNRGYATKIAARLAELAFACREVSVVRAHTLPDARASQRVLSKCGFDVVGLVNDPDDGQVLRFEKRRLVVGPTSRLSYAPLEQLSGMHMNQALEDLFRTLRLDQDASERIRLEFGYACALRVQQFLEDAAASECLRGLGQYLAGTLNRVELARLATRAAAIANGHEGSRSLDGAGHAAVSATYAVAHALAGKALQAADYAAYATVYGHGGYGAVADQESFEPEFQWQLACMSRLASVT